MNYLPLTPRLSGHNEDKKIPAIIDYIRNYIRGLHSREAFDFFNWFMEQYDFAYMHSLFEDKDRYYRSTYFFVDAFYQGDRSYSYYGGKEEVFTIKRSFLTEDEHRQVFEWLDSYMFQFKAESYIEFAILMLKDSFITTLYSNGELRKIYNLVKDTGSKEFSKYANDLKQKYLTQDELQAEEDRRQAAKEKQKLEEQNRKIQELREEFTQLSNNTFKGVLDFLDKHKYSFSNQDDANRIVKENLSNLLESNNYTMKRKEIGRFIYVCGYLIKHNELSVATFKQYLEKIMEVEIYENI